MDFLNEKNEDAAFSFRKYRSQNCWSLSSTDIIIHYTSTNVYCQPTDSELFDSGHRGYLFSSGVAECKVNAMPMEGRREIGVSYVDMEYLKYLKWIHNPNGSCITYCIEFY